ncbi:hypothetical protein ACFY12_12305 [Streptomyces sp. NPDC001339]|uniref:hypothetical protein n=1 Tax=Streptomyces sp. NPDC001339 TaxID=3364563 RepID=UPI0036B99558
MPDLDFYAHVATRGDVLGAGIGSLPADWEAKLGPAYVDNTSQGLIGRDYGLVELSFQEDEETGTWPCFGISLQIHRLLGGGIAVPPSIEEAHGTFAHRVKFDELSAVISSQGYSIEPDDDPSGTDDIRRYRVSESGARIFVIAEVDPYGLRDVDPDDPTEEQVGDVWAISVSPAWWSARR